MRAKLFFILLIGLLVLLPITSEAQIVNSGTFRDNITWTLDDSLVLTISGTGPIATGYTDYPASWPKTPVKIVIESGITSIGREAFSNCSNLEEIVIPEGVTSIEANAFIYCSKLRNIHFPASLQTVSGAAFYGCSQLAEFSVAEGNPYLASCDGILFSADLKKIYKMPNAWTGYYKIPETVTEIKDYAFRQCFRMTGVTIPKSVTSLGYASFEECRITEISIPESISIIGGNCFSYSSLEKVEFADSVTHISAYAFSSCSKLNHVVVPENTETIGRRAFSYCTGMTEITILSKNAAIEDDAFYSANSSLVMTVLPNSKALEFAINHNVDYVLYEPPEVSGFAYTVKNNGVLILSYNGEDTSVSVPAEIDGLPVISIGGGAFAGCTGLTNIVIPESIRNIGKDAFSGCANLNKVSMLGQELVLEGVTSSDSVSVHGSDGISSYSYLIGNNQRAYAYGGNKYFYDIPGKDWSSLGVKDIYLLPGFTGIGNYAFYNCDSSMKIYLSDNITYIDSGAFLMCSARRYANVGTNTAFTFSKMGSSLWVPGKNYALRHLFQDDVPVGMALTGVEKDVTIFTIPEEVIEIGESAFSGCSSLETVYIHDNITSIGGQAFYSCKGLKEISLPDHVFTIGQDAFSGCTAVRYASLGSDTAKVLSRGGYSFRTRSSNCDMIYLLQGDEISGLQATSTDKNAETVIISEGVTSIRDFAFSDHQNLTEVIIPKSVTEIGKYAFNSCKKLQSVSIPEDVTVIPASAFYGCSSLKSVALPHNLIKIDEYAFGYCSNLVSIDLPQNLISIGPGAFSSCSSLSSLIIPDSVRDVDYSFDYRTVLYANADSNAAEALSRNGKSFRIPGTSYELICLFDGDTKTGLALRSAGKDLTDAVIPDGVTHIESFAFSGCTGLTSVVLPSSLKNIGNSVFNNCSGITSIYIPLGVEWIGSNNFYSVSPDAISVDCYSYAESFFIKNGMDVKRVHDWGEAEYTWSENHTTVTAQRICERDHSHIIQETVNTTASVSKEPTCFEPGDTTYTTELFTSDLFETQSLTLTDIEAGHIWKAPEYSWSEDHGSVTAIRICTRDAKHREEETAEAVAEVTRTATCETKGETTYTSASFNNTAFQAQQIVLTDISALGHLWSEVNYTWSEDYTEVTACRICTRDENHTENETVRTVFDYSEYPSCTVGGKADITSCAFENSAFTVQKREDVLVPAMGHDWKEPVYTWADDLSTVTAYHTCRRDGKHMETETVQTTAQTVRSATCEANGSRRYTSSRFANEAFSIQTKAVTLQALGHSERIDAGKEPTCLENGKTDGTSCERCGKILTAQRDIPATGHTLEITETAIEPGCTTPGRTASSYCSVCGEVCSVSEEIPPVGHKPVTAAAIDAGPGISGLTAGTYCETCGIVLEDAMVIPPTGADLGGNMITDSYGIVYDVNHGIGKSNYIFYSDKIDRTNEKVEFQVIIYFNKGGYAQLGAEKEKGSTSCMKTLGKAGDKLYIPMITIQTGPEGTKILAEFITSEPGKAGCYAFIGSSAFNSGGIPVTNSYNIYDGTWEAYYTTRGRDKVYVYNRTPFKDWRIYLESDGTSIDGPANNSFGLNEWWVDDDLMMIMGGQKFITDSNGMVGMYTGIDNNTGLAMYMYYRRVEDSEASSDVKPYIGTWKAYAAVKDSEGIVVPVSELNDSVYKRVFIHSDNTIFIPVGGSLTRGRLTVQNKQLYIDGQKSSLRINQAGQLIRDLNNGITLMYMRLGDDPIPDLVKYTNTWYSYGVVRNTASGTFFADTTGLSDYLEVKIQVNLDGTITENYCGKESNGTWTIENGKFAATGLYHDIILGAGDVLLCDLGNDCYLAFDKTKPEQSSGPSTLPRNLKEIGEESFFAAGIRKLIIPDSCTAIGKSAFSKCPELSVVCIPDSVTSIDENAFENSKNLLIICESNNTAAAYARRNRILYVVKNR